MAKTDIITLDLNFQGMTSAVASYAIRHSSGAILIESGPASTIEQLKAGLSAHGLSPSDITHVFLTHIHLDHAGAAGWFARQGAHIYVHPKGAPHLVNPEKLLASARRIYGEDMDRLWGEFLPVPESHIILLAEGEEIKIGSLRVVPIETPGHADHHFVFLFEDTCFTGDVGGIRIQRYPYLRVPMPPPELHFGKWHSSIARLRREKITHIAPTHFGIYDDPEWHLRAVDQSLDDAERWLAHAMPQNPSIQDLRQQFKDWMNEQAIQQSMSADDIRSYELANPLGMSADGMLRYWNKVREHA
jgi:glyoxylase-like metal-dependent hydrolase (beta-lactamase superfamily II)